MNKYLIPNLSNACQVIKDLLLHGEQGRSFVNLQQDLDIPKSTLFRILKTLEHENMVQKREGLLYPGPVLQGSASGGGNERLRKLAVPVLQELADRTGETAHLAVLKGFQALILEVCDGPNPVHVASRPGTLASLVNSATGKVLLTFHFGEHVQDVLDHISFEARTPHSITRSGRTAARDRFCPAARLCRG
ncbi:MAG: helix-turn-helix domain-containing protein [candidate division KSB1 bacterium]|nr:helix-turn-helix domain-containing protein [candidate division KSB1 bacterium]